MEILDGEEAQQIEANISKKVKEPYMPKLLVL